MKTRIIQSRNQNRDWFTPQWSTDGVLWQEFFGFDKDSPYLHMRSFGDKVTATEFLKDVSIIHGTVIWESK